MHQSEAVIAVTVTGAAIIIGTAALVKAWKPIVIRLEPPRRRSEPSPSPPEPAPAQPAPQPDIIPLPADLTPGVPQINYEPARRYFGGATPVYTGLLR